MANKNDISTIKADKGGAVIIDVEDYAKEAEHQLSNEDTYKNPSKWPNTNTYKIVPWHNSTFQNDKSITENIAKGLKVQQSETTKFYIRPKIYKTGNPGYTVVISINCHTNANGICNEYNLCSSIRKYLHGAIWKTAYISVHQK